MDATSLGAEVAAAVATLVAALAAGPQVWRVVGSGDHRGVSLTSAALGIGSELAWFTYALEDGLHSALPEAVMMFTANGVLAVALFARGAATRRPVAWGIGWLVVLAAVHAAAGTVGLGAVLGVSYVVQVTPAVWTVWRTASPSGVSAATWVLIGVEGVLWGGYGLHHGDPTVITFAATATLAALATLTRKAAVRTTLPARP